MTYTAWSVVFGEQPSASKWNQLGTNDASFNDGTGIAVSAITPEKLLTGTGTSWPWTSYTPTWTSSGTAPAIGNGTLSGAYKQTGKTVNFRIFFQAGSTTTFGTSAYFFSLPVTANSFYTAASLNGSFSGGGYAEDNGVAGYVLMSGRINSSTGLTKFQAHYVNSAAGAAGTITATSPFTWANTDYFYYSGTYEAA